MRFFDFSSHGSYWLSLLPEVVLAVAAMVILMWDAFSRPHADSEAVARRPDAGRTDVGGGRAPVDFLIAPSC